MDANAPLENSSPENRELVGRIRELGRLLPGHSEINWQESRRRCGDVLRGLVGQTDKNRRLAELLKGERHIVGGDEHHIVRVSSDPDRVYKITHGDNFGCRSYFSAADPELLGNFHGETNADPFLYLIRWVLLNCISGYQTRFEGFLPSEKPGWLPRICVSQPELPKDNPTSQEIRDVMSNYQFHEISTHAFFQPETRLLLTDAAPRNVRIVDGVPVPFDAIAQIPSGRVLQWCEERCRR